LWEVYDWDDVDRGDDKGRWSARELGMVGTGGTGGEKDDEAAGGVAGEGGIMIR
jgi:hypothetical protein